MVKIKEKVMKKDSLNPVLQVLQILVLAIGLAGVFIRLGESQAKIEYNHSELTELKEIARDLVGSQLEFAATDARLEERIEGLRIRLDSLESRR